MRTIDADALKKCAIPCQIHNGALTDMCVPVYQIDNAPTVEYPFYQEAYQTGYEEGKEDVIHSIATQYSEHNELVPIWLRIGDLKGGAEC